MTFRKKLTCLLMAAFCLLSLVSCGREAVDPSRLFQVYFISNSETRVEVHEYVMQSDTLEERVEEMLNCLSSTSSRLAYKAPLNMGFTLLGYRLENETLTLNMSEEYNEMAPTKEVLVRAALVCSLTQIDGIGFVEITVEGNPLYDNLNNMVGRMKGDQFINNMGSEISSYDMADLNLYFANKTGDQLIEVNRKKAYNTNISLDRLVVEQIIAGPGQEVEGLVFPTVNSDTQIVSVRTRDGICYVNLDAGFLNQTYNVTADVTIYSIVNSLVELSTVNKVQISINGDTSGTYRDKYSFSTIFERNLDIVTTLE